MNSSRESLAFQSVERQENFARSRRFKGKCAAFNRFFAQNFAACCHLLRLKLRESILQQLLTIAKRPAGHRFHRDRQNSPRFSRRRIGFRGRCDQAVTGLTRVTGFETVAQIPAKQQFIAVHHDARRPNFPVSANRCHFLTRDFADKRNFERGASNDSQIVRRGEVLRVVQTMRINEMRVAATQLARFLVHQSHKFRLISAHTFSYRDTGIIGRMNQCGLDEFAQRAVFAFEQPDAAFARVGGIFSGPNNLVEVAMFHGHQTRHYFGRRGRKQAQIPVFRVQNPTGIEVEDETCDRARRDGRNCKRCNGKR